MLIANGDGTFIGGPLDARMILYREETKTYHASFFEELPMPGPVLEVENVESVRLRCKMHHTQGSTTLEGAIEHLNEIAQKIELPDENRFLTPILWDGTHSMMFFTDNWRKSKTSSPSDMVASI
jgi:hypothetical protein